MMSLSKCAMCNINAGTFHDIQKLNGKLIQENQRLKAENEKLKRDYDKIFKGFGQSSLSNKALEEENAALKIELQSLNNGAKLGIELFINQAQRAEKIIKDLREWLEKKIDTIQKAIDAADAEFGDDRDAKGRINLPAFSEALNKLKELCGEDNR